MADIAINPVSRRVQYTGNTGLGPFAFTFNILADADIAVYKNTTLLTLTSEYTVSTNADGTGSITLTGSGNGTALIASDVLTLIGARLLERTTDFVAGGDFFAASINEQLDSQVIMAQQLDEKLTRAIKVNPGDEFSDLELPLKADRIGKTLQFNATTGDPEAGPSIADVANAQSNALAAASSATAAATSASSASSSASAASSSATNAASSETAAAASETAAAASESAAATSETNAANSATSAASSSSSASTSATSAASSASSASTSATNAATSETNAASSASSASTSATNAATSETNAANSATSASTSASSAATSATNAAASETNAATSETNAATSETNAATSATNAATSETNAATSASNASTSETNAANSATAAASSATSAASAQAAAESARDTTLAAYDSFDDRYLGTKTSDPTLDNDGNALVAGALYFNSTDGAMKVYTGSAWVAAYVSGTGFLALSGGTMTGDLNFGDSVKANFGAGSDLQIYHDGSHSFIKDTGTGNLFIDADAITYIRGNSGTENIAKFNANGAVELFYDDAQKLATTSTGIDVTGTITADGLDMEDNQKILLGASDDLQIYHDGSNSYISDVGTGNLRMQGVNLQFESTNGDIYFNCLNNAQVALRYDNSTKFETTSYGVFVAGDMYATGRIGLDDGDQIAWSNNTHCNISVNAATRVRIESDGDLHADGDVIAYSTTISDPRLKTDIQKIEGALDKLCTLSGYTFTYTPDNTASAGILSTEVAAVLPSAIRPKRLPLKTGDDETVYDTVQYDQLHGLLIEAIKELREEVADLKAKIEG